MVQQNNHLTVVEIIRSWCYTSLSVALEHRIGLVESILAEYVYFDEDNFTAKPLSLVGDHLSFFGWRPFVFQYVQIKNLMAKNADCDLEFSFF